MSSSEGDTMEEAPRSVRLRSGHTAWVRPVRRSDAVELQRAFALLSDLSRYRRFLTGTPHLTGRQAAYLSDVDHRNHDALVALLEPRGTDIVGVARFIRYPATPTDAELAITVVDEWHGHGLATSLLRLLSKRARDVGVRRFAVDMLADNAAVLGLLRGAGLNSEVAEGHLISGHIEL
jgi:RimJ/RimL family protein N-acetyltransferase